MNDDDFDHLVIQKFLADVHEKLDSWKGHPVYSIVQRADDGRGLGDRDLARQVVYLLGYRDAVTELSAALTMGVPEELHNLDHLVPETEPLAAE